MLLQPQSNLYFVIFEKYISIRGLVPANVGAFMLPVLLTAGAARLATRWLDQLLHGKKTTEKALANCEEKYETLVNQVSDGVSITHGHVIDFANARLSEITGYSGEELTRLDFEELFHPDDKKYVRDHWHDDEMGQLERETPARILTRDGSIRWVVLRSLAVEWHGKRAELNFIHDLTSYRTAIEKARKSEEHFSLFMDHLPAAVFIKDEKSQLVYTNRAMKQMFNADEWLGKMPSEIFGDAMAAKIVESDRRVFSEGYMEEIGSGLDGQNMDRTFQSIRFVFNKDEKQRMLGGIALDVTEKRRIEQDLQKSDERYDTLFHKLPVGIFHYDSTMRIIDFNDQFIKILQSSPQKLMGFDLKSIKDRVTLPALISALEGNEGFYEGIYRVTTSPAEVYISMRTVPSHGEDGKITGGLGIIEDITERKRAELQVQRQLQQLAALRAVDLAIANNTDLSSTLKVLLQEVVTQLGGDAVALLLLNPENLMLEYAAERGFHTPFIRHTRLQLGQGYAGEIALSRRIIQVSIDGQDPNRFLTSPMAIAEGFAAYCGVPLLVKGMLKGVLEIYHRAAMEPTTEWLDFLQTLAGHAGIAIENTTLFEELQRANGELIQAYDSTIEGWARALELRDGETEGHSQRVTHMAMNLARRMGFMEEDLIHVRRGALLHDIGKMGIPDSILLKPGGLNGDEWEVMRNHPVYAYRLLSSVDFLKPALDIPYYHHERWDGSGYPRGLQGNEIPKAARVFSIVDVWDALLSDRPYRKAWEKEKVVAYLKQQVGTYFDPTTMEEFLDSQGK
jgi:PAS domain S-box-containing protein/putative nucleotidyltransferase with HDIG domain